MVRKKQTLRLFAKDITGDIIKDRQEVTVNWRAGQLVLDEPSWTLSFGQSVTDEQKERLLWIAVNYPVARLLQGEIGINTHLSDDPAVAAGMGNYPLSDEASTDAAEKYSTQ